MNFVKRITSSSNAGSVRRLLPLAVSSTGVHPLLAARVRFFRSLANRQNPAEHLVLIKHLYAHVRKRAGQVKRDRRDSNHAEIGPLFTYHLDIAVLLCFHQWGPICKEPVEWRQVERVLHVVPILQFQHFFEQPFLNGGCARSGSNMNVQCCNADRVLFFVVLIGKLGITEIVVPPALGRSNGVATADV